jgi:hypothetical protein
MTKATPQAERGQLQYCEGVTRHAVAFRDMFGFWIRLEYFTTYRAAAGSIPNWSRKYPNKEIFVIAAKGAN